MSAEHGGGGDSATKTPLASHNEACLPEEPVSCKDEGVKDIKLKEDQTVPIGKENSRVQRISSDLRGVVRWYNSRLCYGFIEREDTKCELFVHRNSVVMAPGEPVFLRAESEVLFDLWTLPDGRLEAQAVRAANGEPISLRGSRPAGLPRSSHYAGHTRSHDFYTQPNVYGCCVPTYCPCCARPIWHGSGGVGGSAGGRSRRGLADTFGPSGGQNRRTVHYVGQPLDKWS